MSNETLRRPIQIGMTISTFEMNNGFNWVLNPPNTEPVSIQQVRSVYVKSVYVNVRECTPEAVDNQAKRISSAYLASNSVCSLSSGSYECAGS
jgi:hypothetical protein